MVEHRLAKARVAGPTPVSRLEKTPGIIDDFGGFALSVAAVAYPINRIDGNGSERWPWTIDEAAAFLP